jgi:hypothetical protein
MNDGTHIEPTVAPAIPPKKRRLTNPWRHRMAVDQAEANIDDVVVLLEAARNRLFRGVPDAHKGAHFARKSEPVSEIERGICDALRVAYMRVDASNVCADFGIDRRTLGRRVKERIRGEGHV